MQDVKILITDLDDTVWDWLTMWYCSFSPFFNSLAELCKIKRDMLIKDFKALHQKYGSAEVSYAYKELKTIGGSCYGRIEDDDGGTISLLHQYYRDKKNSLKLYDGVLETLNYIKSKGTAIVGFTESNVFYTKYRIKTLDIDGIFDSVYSTENHVLPESVRLYYPADHWDLKKTGFEILPNGFKKPDPKILEGIINDYDLGINDAVYIGDKLDRDVYMANKIMMTSVYARYGNRIESDKYELLKEVSHWTDEEIAREAEFKNSIKRISIVPSFTVDNFCEILDIFNFTGGL